MCCTTPGSESVQVWTWYKNLVCQWSVWTTLQTGFSTNSDKQSDGWLIWTGPTQVECASAGLRCIRLVYEMFVSSLGCIFINYDNLVMKDFAVAASDNGTLPAETLSVTGHTCSSNKGKKTTNYKKLWWSLCKLLATTSAKNGRCEHTQTLGYSHTCS